MWCMIETGWENTFNELTRRVTCPKQCITTITPKANKHTFTHNFYKPNCYLHIYLLQGNWFTDVFDIVRIWTFAVGCEREIVTHTIRRVDGTFKSTLSCVQWKAIQAAFVCDYDFSVDDDRHRPKYTVCDFFVRFLFSQVYYCILWFCIHTSTSIHWITRFECSQRNEFSPLNCFFSSTAFNLF